MWGPNGFGWGGAVGVVLVDWRCACSCNCVRLMMSMGNSGRKAKGESMHHHQESIQAHFSYLLRGPYMDLPIAPSMARLCFIESMAYWTLESASHSPLSAFCEPRASPISSTSMLGFSGSFRSFREERTVCRKSRTLSLWSQCWKIATDSSRYCWWPRHRRSP